MKLENLKRITSKLVWGKNKYDTSLIWKGIQHLITLTSKSKRQTSTLAVKGKEVRNPKTSLIHFSTNIGPSLSKTIPNSYIEFENFFNNF